LDGIGHLADCGGQLGAGTVGSEVPPSRGKGAKGMGAVVVLVTGATVLGAVIASVIAEERGRWQRH